MIDCLLLNNYFSTIWSAAVCIAVAILLGQQSISVNWSRKCLAWRPRPLNAVPTLFMTRSTGVYDECSEVKTFTRPRCYTLNTYFANL